jgi:hypothetical protein
MLFSRVDTYMDVAIEIMVLKEMNSTKAENM